ncbi:MAG: hypothetical protein ACE5LL_04875 [Alphaproteobacteria bacterium]
MAAENARHRFASRSKGNSPAVPDKLELRVALTPRERLFRHFQSTLCSSHQP